MEKRIELDNGRVIIFSIDKEYGNRVVIREGFINEDGDILKDYVMVMGNDYSFTANINDYDLRRISFEFDENHPLYLPLLHLIGEKGELLIDDDDTLYENIKYMRIYKNKKIVIEFVNKVFDNYDKFDYDNFSIFVKNTQYDLRSKIDCKGEKTKYQLFKFFAEVNREINKYEKNNKTKKLV